jgi:hypothetical protein
MLNPGTVIDAAAVRAQLTGEFFAPADEGWDEARLAWNLAVDQQPDFVALPADAADVVALVRIAAEAGLRVAAQGTGHNASPLDLDGAMLIKTERMRGVEIDPETRIARVEAGVTWGEVAGPAAEHGLMPLQGSSHDVGVVGYTLGGGMPLIARKYGLAAEHMVAAEIVGADGELRRVDRDNDPDLFWALRGGGGSFGVVTAIEIKLLDRATIYAGALFFSLEKAPQVLDAWTSWVDALPDEMTTIASMRNFPPFPDVPEPVRGKSFTVIEAFWTGSPEEGDRLLAPMRALCPDMDTVGEVNAVELLQIHMDPPMPVPGIGDHQMLERFDEAAMTRLVEAAGAGSEGPPLAMVEIRHAGGALAERAADCGALGAIEGKFATFSVGMLPAPEMAPPLVAKLARIREALAPADAGTNYLNFAEARVEPETIFGDRLNRLREVRDAYGAEMFRANHELGA